MPAEEAPARLESDALGAIPNAANKSVDAVSPSAKRFRRMVV